MMERKSNFAATARDRWKSDTPPFFKRIAKAGKMIAYVGGIVTAGLTSLATAGVAIPVAVPIIIGCVTAMAATASATAGLATEDKEIQARQYDKNTVPEEDEIAR